MGSIELATLCDQILTTIDPARSLRGSVLDRVESDAPPPPGTDKALLARLKKHKIPLNVVWLKATPRVRDAAPSVREFGAPEDLYWRCAMCFGLSFVCCNAFVRILKMLPSYDITHLTHQKRHLTLSRFRVLAVKFVPRSVHLIVSETRKEGALVERTWGTDDLVYRMLPCYSDGDDLDPLVIDIAGCRYGIRGTDGSLVCIVPEDFYKTRIQAHEATAPFCGVLPERCLAEGEVVLEGSAVENDLAVERVAVSTLARMGLGPPLAPVRRARFRTTVTGCPPPLMPFRNVNYTSGSVTLESLCLRVIEAWECNNRLQGTIFESIERNASLPPNTVGVTIEQMAKLNLSVNVIRTRPGKRSSNHPMTAESFRAPDDLFWRCAMAGACEPCVSAFIRILQTLPLRRISHQGRPMSVDRFKILEQELHLGEVHVVVYPDGDPPLAIECLEKKEDEAVKRFVMCYDDDLCPLVLDITGSRYGIRGKLLLPESLKCQNFLIASALSWDVSDSSETLQSMLGRAYDGLGLGPPPKKVVCCGCHQPLETKLSCSRCDAVYYCGLSCQRDDWPHHKTLCKRTARKPP
eukprot:Polyplicarium_translucidae@DN2498_c0_g1_i2.p1